MLKLAQLLNSSPFCLLNNLNRSNIPRTFVRSAMFSLLYSQNGGVFRCLTPVLSGFYGSFLFYKTRIYGYSVSYPMYRYLTRPLTSCLIGPKQDERRRNDANPVPLFNNLDSAMWELLKGGSLVTETNERANRSGLYQVGSVG